MLSAEDSEVNHGDAKFTEESINKSHEDFSIPQGIEYLASPNPKMFHELDEVDLRPPKRYRVTQHHELDSPGYYDSKAAYTLQNESKIVVKKEAENFLPNEMGDSLLRDRDGKIVEYAFAKQIKGILPNESRPSPPSKNGLALENDGGFIELLDNGHIRKVAFR